MSWASILELPQINQLEKARHFINLLGYNELQIIKLAVDGFDDQIIADRLNISKHTVRRHIDNIQDKTPKIYEQRLSFRRQLIPKLAPYLFLFRD